MGVPTSEVGYTPAMPRREDHEVQKDMWWHWKKKKKKEEKSLVLRKCERMHSRNSLCPNAVITMPSI